MRTNIKNLLGKSDKINAAILIRKFLCGEITNYEFEDLWPKSEDPLIQSAFSDIWRLYDDYPESYIDIKKLAFFERKRAVRLIRCLNSQGACRAPSL
jgi:hypothetical protein